MEGLCGWADSQGGTQGVDYDEDERARAADKEAAAKGAWGVAKSSNPERFSHVYLYRNPVVFGRHPASDVVLETRAASGTHAKLYFQKAGEAESICFVEDWSTNGTFVNGHFRVGKGNRLVVDHGAEITLVPGDSSGARPHISYYIQLFDSPQAATNRANRRTFESEYRIGRQLGMGGTATVFHCVQRSTGEQFAVKRVFKRHVGDDCAQQINRHLIECEAAQAFQHPNIIRTIEVFEEDDHWDIVLELATGGDLFDCMRTKGVFTEVEARIVIGQINEALAYLHSHGIVHRDVKLENVLLFRPDQGVVKLSDLGLSRYASPNTAMKTVCGTLSYMAPEQLEPNAEYGSPVDMWALGVMLYTMLSEQMPFDLSRPNRTSATSDVSRRMDEAETVDSIRWDPLEFPDDLWAFTSSAAKDLITNLLEKDPTKRPSAKEVRRHQWLRESVAGNNPRAN